MQADIAYNYYMDLIDQAFLKTPRIGFVPEELKDQADIDEPLPIGFNQAISQPKTVRMMLEWLDAQPGEKVLDIGSGSGWSTALLSHIVGDKGMVFAVEKIPELVKFGQANCQNAGIKNALFFEAGKKLGLPECAPYDRILVSASAIRFPSSLIDQLNVGGKLVIPVLQAIVEVTKVSDQDFGRQVHPGFKFVPLR